MEDAHLWKDLESVIDLGYQYFGLSPDRPETLDSESGKYPGSDTQSPELDNEICKLLDESMPDSTGVEMGQGFETIDYSSLSSLPFQMDESVSESEPEPPSGETGCSVNEPFVVTNERYVTGESENSTGKYLIRDADPLFPGRESCAGSSDESSDGHRQGNTDDVMVRCAPCLSHDLDLFQCETCSLDVSEDYLQVQNDTAGIGEYFETDNAELQGSNMTVQSVLLLSVSGGIKREELDGPAQRERSRSRSPATQTSPKASGRKRKLNVEPEADSGYVSRLLEELEMQKEMEQDKAKKNAIIAKINREKKKLKTGVLEEVTRNLQEENNELRNKYAKKEQECENLTTEVQYLKNVLKYQSMLSHLLKNIPNSGVNLSSSFVGDQCHDTQHQNAVKVEPTVGSGVCLHVNQDNVSLEFCSKCASMASQTVAPSGP